MKICDVCYANRGSVTFSTHTIWHKKREGYADKKVTLETCREHSNLFKGNSFEANEALAQNVKDLINRR